MPKILRHKTSRMASDEEVKAAFRKYEDKLAEEAADAAKRDLKRSTPSDHVKLKYTETDRERAYQEERPLIKSFEHLIDKIPKFNLLGSTKTK